MYARWLAASLNCFLSLIACSIVRADVQFVDVAPARGLDMAVTRPLDGWAGTDLNVIEMIVLDNLGAGVAVGDYDGDGDLDIYLLGSLGQPNRLFRNDLDSGVKGFTDVTLPPLDDAGMGRAAQFIDLDGDGWLDLVLLNEEDELGLSRSRIFKNVAGTFVDVTEGSGFELHGFAHGGLGFADIDGDGLVDIYVSGWPNMTSDPFPRWGASSHLFRNLGGFQFDDVTAEAGLEMGSGEGDHFSAVFVNLVGSPYPELFVAVDHGVDKLYRTTDGLTFENIAPLVGIDHLGNGMGVAVGDVDGDLDLDLYVTKISDPWGVFGSAYGNAYYRNNHSDTGVLAFEEAAWQAGIEDSYWGWGTELTDVDNDGDLDLVAVSGFDSLIYWFAGELSPLFATPGALWINDGSGDFQRTLGTDLDLPDDARALLAFDYDRDGDQDLLITSMHGSVRLLENRSHNAGNAIDLILAPDALAVTATVTAFLGERAIRRDLLLGRSYLTGAPQEVHLGLGDADAIDGLQIRWADGVETDLGPLESGQVVEIRRCTDDADCDGVGPCTSALCPLRPVWQHSVGPADEEPLPLDASVPLPAPDAGPVDAGGEGGADGGSPTPPAPVADAGAPPGGTPPATHGSCSVPGARPSHVPPAYVVLLLLVACWAASRGSVRRDRARRR
jgi:enediyne biosynthesis protein E4